MVHDEWVNIDEHERCTGAISFPSLVKQGRRKHHYNPKGGAHLSQYSEYSGWSSERDINLTLRQWVFICLWEMWGARQMTVPILQKPLTVHTHPAASAFVSGLVGSSQSKWKDLIEPVLTFHVSVWGKTLSCQQNMLEPFSPCSKGNTFTSSLNSMLSFYFIIYQLYTYLHGLISHHIL